MFAQPINGGMNGSPGNTYITYHYYDILSTKINASGNKKKKEEVLLKVILK